MERAGPRTIARADLQDWVAVLMRRAEVVAPVEADGGDTFYLPVRTPSEVKWEFGNSLLPPKQYALPQTDPLLSATKGDDGYRLQEIADSSPRILLNVRSCDVTGMGYLRRVHAFDLPDATVVRRIDSITTVSLACTEPCESGFCVCCDAGPFLHGLADVQLTALGDRFLAEPASGRGRELLDEAGTLFSPAAEADVARRVEREEVARRKFGDETCHIGSAMRRMSAGRTTEELWESMSPWCLECGSCNFVCPTCYCFSVKDRREGAGYLRCRLWDSCQYASFTLEASGHNPRQHRRDRIKRRFFHKISAQYYKRDGAVGCVGCGRCVKVCLGTTDMPAVVAAVRKGTWNG